MAETLSVEAVNQMRIAMGLKPIPVPSDTGLAFQKEGEAEEEQDEDLDSRQARAGDNWAKLEEQRLANEAREKRKEQIKRQREQAARSAVIQGSGIADVEDDLGATDWLKSMKKRQTKIEAQETERRRQAESRKAETYDSKDLAGIRVAHQLGDIEGEGILTFKDQAIGEGDSDEEFELENRDLVEQQALKKRLESKKFKGVAYDPNSTEANGILQQYDEEISGAKKNFVTLDARGEANEQAGTSSGQLANQPKSLVISLDSLLETPISDYKEQKEIKIKKPKKTKKTSRKRNRDEDDEDIFTTGGAAAAMEVDIPAAAPKAKKRIIDDFDDANEDLAAQLAKQRRQALKARKAMRPTDFAKQLKEEDASAMDAVETVEGDEGGLVIDETKEWAGALDPEAIAAQQAAEDERRRRREASTHTPKPKEEDEDVDMGYAEAEELEEAAARAERTPSVPPVTSTGIGEEESIGGGLGATLKMLKDRNLVEGDGSNSENWSSKVKFLRDRAKKEEDAEYRARRSREEDRQRMQGLSVREREEIARQQNVQRDQAESRKLQDLFEKEYRPNITLTYTDDMGRSLNQKEAFKHLSHQFHGKGSGKQKQEKRLKKVEDEKKRMAASSLDGSQYASGMGDKKKNKQAGVRLQ